MKKKILSAVISAFMVMSLSSCGTISDETKAEMAEQAYDNHNNGKGAAQIQEIVDAYLLAIQNADVSPLEKYLDANLDYPDLADNIKVLSNSKIDTTTAEYFIIDEFNSNGAECRSLKIEAEEKGFFGDKLTYTLYIHKAGRFDFWFIGAPTN